jgi:hypothetical protein
MNRNRLGANLNEEWSYTNTDTRTCQRAIRRDIPTAGS